MRSVAFLLALGIACGIGQAEVHKSAAPKPATVDLLSVEINKECPPDKRSLVALGPEGTTLRLVVTEPDRVILGIDTQGSTLTQAVDDKGTDLTKGASDSSWLDPSVKISKDQHMVSTLIHFPATPAAGAGRMNLAGALILRCGSGNVPGHTQFLTMTPNHRFFVGAVVFTLKSVTDASSGVTVVFDSKVIPDMILSLEFHDESDSVIASQKVGEGIPTPTADGVYELTYNLARKVDKAKVVVTYYRKVESVSVPLSLDVGVGF